MLFSGGFSPIRDLYFLLKFSMYFPYSIYLSVLTMMCYRMFLFWSCLVGVLYASFIYMGMPFFSLGTFFFWGFAKDLVNATDLGFFFLIYICNSNTFAGCPIFLSYSFPVLTSLYIFLLDIGPMVV